MSLAAGSAAELRAAERGDVYPGLARLWVLLTGGDGKEVRAVERALARGRARKEMERERGLQDAKEKVAVHRAAREGAEAGLRAVEEA